MEIFNGYMWAKIILCTPHIITVCIMFKLSFMQYLMSTFKCSRKWVVIWQLALVKTLMQHHDIQPTNIAGSEDWQNEWTCIHNTGMVFVASYVLYSPFMHTDLAVICSHSPILMKFGTISSSCSETHHFQNSFHSGCSILITLTPNDMAYSTHNLFRCEEYYSTMKSKCIPSDCFWNSMVYGNYTSSTSSFML